MLNVDTKILNKSITTIFANVAKVTFICNSNNYGKKYTKQTQLTKPLNIYNRNILLNKKMLEPTTFAKLVTKT